MRAACICNALCRRHLSHHTHNSPHCCRNGSLSAAPQSAGLNDGTETLRTSLNIVLFRCGSLTERRLLCEVLLFHLVLRWVEWRLRSLSSTCKSKEWIPERICSGGRRGHFSLHCLQPNTLAPTGELQRETVKTEL